nr:uncharacterized protein LOC133621984 [Nerophis lumbriciformis]
MTSAASTPPTTSSSLTLAPTTSSSSTLAPRYSSYSSLAGLSTAPPAPLSPASSLPRPPAGRAQRQPTGARTRRPLWPGQGHFLHQQQRPKHGYVSRRLLWFWRHSRLPSGRPRRWSFLGRPPRRLLRRSTRRRHQTRPRWIRGHLGRRPTSSSPLHPPLTFDLCVLVVPARGHLGAVHKEGDTVTARAHWNASSSLRAASTAGHAHDCGADLGTRRARLRPAAAASCNHLPAIITPAWNEGAAFISLDILACRRRNIIICWRITSVPVF